MKNKNKEKITLLFLILVFFLGLEILTFMTK